MQYLITQNHCIIILLHINETELHRQQKYNELSYLKQNIKNTERLSDQRSLFRANNHKHKNVQLCTCMPTTNKRQHIAWQNVKFNHTQ